MDKSSITLLETIISLTILSIFLGGFIRFSFEEDNNSPINTLKNFDNSNFTNFKKERLSYKIDTRSYSVDVNTTTYEDEKFTLKKYEL